jgi:Predicted membrane protein/domain
MSAAAETVPRPARIGKREKIVDFSPYKVSAPFILRCGALLIDYIVIIAVPVITLLLIVTVSGDRSGRVTGVSNSTGWMLGILVYITNFFVLPLVNGQTIGKMLTGIRIVKLDGSPVRPGSLLLRQVLGFLFTVCTGGAGFLVAAFSRSGRALHDFIAGTAVIYARRRTLK